MNAVLRPSRNPLTRALPRVLVVALVASLLPVPPGPPAGRTSPLLVK
jgi:hypothetical protein